MLSEANLTDAALVHLQQAPSLQILNINIAHFTDKGAEHLSKSEKYVSPHRE